MKTTTINRHGQITLPIVSRREAGVQAGEEVIRHFAHGKRTIRPKKESSLSDFQGLFPHSNKHFSDEDISKAQEEVLAQRFLTTT